MDKAPPEFLIYALARQAFSEADALAEHLLGLDPKPTPSLFTACVTGIVTSYCRPFMPANGLAGLPPEMAMFPSKELETTHADVVEIRHKFSAHFDRKHGVKINKIGTFSLPLSEVRFMIRDDEFEVATNAATLSPKSVLSVRALCAFQIQRTSDRLKRFAIEIKDKENRMGEFVYAIE